MKSSYRLLVISLVVSLIGCVTIQSNTKSDAVPPIFRRVLIVTKMLHAPDTYVQRFAQIFPGGYETCTLALSPLSFDNPEETIRKQVESCHSEVILTLELVRPAYYGYRTSYPYQYNVEMRSVATGQPFWKAIISSNPNNGEQVPPGSIIKRLLQDHILESKRPAGDSLQASN